MLYSGWARSYVPLWTNKFASYVITLPIVRSIARCDSVRFSTPLCCNDDTQPRTNNVPLINVLTPCWAEYAPRVNEKRETGGESCLEDRNERSRTETFQAYVSQRDIIRFSYC
jgi:hypothetical protein